MINAHCEQSYKVWAEDDKKLYNFRILELSEPFCEGKKGETVLSRSCDNVAQRLKQAERYKRISESWHSHAKIPNSRPKMCTRTQSLPGDLSECGRRFFSQQNTGDDHVFTQNKEKHVREGSLRRKINGFNKESIDSEIHPRLMTQLTKDNNNRKKNSEDKINEERHIGDQSKLRSEKTDAMTNHVISDVIVDDHCANINSNLRELSTRFDQDNLEEKTKPELIAIILELQDALHLSVDD